MNANVDLASASEKGDLEMVKKALQAGADINYHTSGTWAPIIYAAREGHLEVVKYLIEQGADMNVENPYTETALCLAGSEEVKEYLRGLGAKP